MTWSMTNGNITPKQWTWTIIKLPCHLCSHTVSVMYCIKEIYILCTHEGVKHTCNALRWRGSGFITKKEKHVWHYGWTLPQWREMLGSWMINVFWSLFLCTFSLPHPYPPPPHLTDLPTVPCPAAVWSPLPAPARGRSEEALLPGGVVDQAGAALYGVPPAVAVQGLHAGLGDHHLGVGDAHPWLVLRFHRTAEQSTGMHDTQ